MNALEGIVGAEQKKKQRWVAMGTMSTVGAVLIGLNALHISLVAFGNVTDFATNQAFVQHVLSMDTTNFGSPTGQGLNPAVMWHAIASRPVQDAAYIALIGWEVLAGLVLGAATILWVVARSEDYRTRARALATIGLTMTIVLFVGGFLDIGGEWFQMWRSAQWNGTEAAFRNAVLALLTLLVIHHPGVATERSWCAHGL